MILLVDLVISIAAASGRDAQSPLAMMACGRPGQKGIHRRKKQDRRKKVRGKGKKRREKRKKKKREKKKEKRKRKRKE